LRRASLEILRCVQCQRGHLVPEEAVPEPRLIFGPVKCQTCGARYPVGEGLIDLAGERGPPRGAQRAFELPVVARTYERTMRPLLSKVVVRSGLDVESEYLLFRSLLGELNGPVLDLGCGTGLFSRRLASEQPKSRLIALDVSRPMVEEALAQAREASVAVDFVRAAMPELPFHDATLSAVLMAGSLQLVDGLDHLMRELFRVLKPGGIWVASSFQPPAVLKPLHRMLGLYGRNEEALRLAAQQVGFSKFERVKREPVMVVRAVKG
jgi:ubiquinone/menaquinone biosynthesis C-methylase UbiE